MAISRQLESGSIYINKWMTGLYTQRSPLFAPMSAMGVQLITRMDSLWDGSNIDLTPNMSLKRRAGFTRHCSTQLGLLDYPLSFYSFKNTAGTIKPIVDLPSRVSWFTPTTQTLIATKTSTATTSFTKVGSTLYFCDGVQAKKWNGNVNLLQYSEQFGQSAFWLKTHNTSSDPVISIHATTDPNGVANNADAIAYPTTNVGDYSLIQQTVTGLAGIGGKTVTVSVWLKSGSNTTILLELGDDIGLVASNVQSVTTSWQRFSVTANLNSAATTITAKITQGASAASRTIYAWGAQLELSNAPTTYESVTLRPHPVTGWGITAPSTAATLSFSGGSLSPKSGYKYTYVYKNQSTGHISSAAPISSSTLALTAKNITVSGAGSSDLQVDQIDIYRNTDGGANYYYLATVTNTGGAWNYTDSNADSALNTFLQPALALENNPPPAGIGLTCFYMGRIWAAVGRFLYFGGGPDITNGVPEECFPPGNVFTLPGNITAFAPTSQGLIVWTNDDVFVVLGSDTASFYPKPWQKNFGVASQQCVAQDGDLLFVFTSNGQLFQFSDSLTEIGKPIRDKLGVFDPTTTSITLHRSGVDEGLFVSNGSTTIYRYSVSLGCWSNAWQPATGVHCISSIETSAATYSMMLGSVTGGLYLYRRDLTSYTDDGSTYAAFATIGSLVLAPPGQTALIQSVLVEAMPQGTYPTVSVLLNEISGSFVALPNPVADPPALPASSTISMKRHYLKAAQTPLPQHVRHMQIKISFPSEAAANELLGIAVQ